MKEGLVVSKGSPVGLPFFVQHYPATPRYPGMIPPQKALYLEMQKALAECQFLRDCTVQAHDTEFVYCELVGALTQYLPANRCVIVIEKSRFSVAVVREKYEEIVCQWIQEAYDKSVDLARVPPKPKR